MSEALRQLLGRALEHAVEYREAVGDRPARPLKSYAEMREQFDEPLPEAGADPLAQTRHDIATYVAEARAKSLAWAG